MTQLTAHGAIVAVLVAKAAILHLLASVSHLWNHSGLPRKGWGGRAPGAETCPGEVTSCSQGSHRCRLEDPWADGSLGHIPTEVASLLMRVGASEGPGSASCTAQRATSHLRCRAELSQS